LVQIQASYFSYYLKNDFNNFWWYIRELNQATDCENIDLNNPLILQNADLTENHFFKF
jgi:hypothetical protein